MPQVTIPDHEHKELLSIKDRFLALTSNEKAEPKEKGPNPLQETVDQLKAVIEAADQTINSMTAKIAELEKKNAELQEKLTAPKDDAKE